MKRKLYVASLLALAGTALAARPNTASAERAFKNDASARRDCLYYKKFTEGGGTVTCYDEHGTACVICST